VGLPWPIFQNYNGPLLASHDGASMAAGAGPSKVLCIMLSGQRLEQLGRLNDATVLLFWSWPQEFCLVYITVECTQ